MLEGTPAACQRAAFLPLLRPGVPTFDPLSPQTPYQNYSCCRLGLHRSPSLPTKHALYLFLQGLFTDSPDLVPAASEPAATPSSTHFRNGPLQTGARLDPDRYNVL